MSVSLPTRGGWLRGLALVVGLHLPAKHAAAQAAPTDGNTTGNQTPEDDRARRAEAEAHFSRGLALGNTGDGWEAALAEFQESRRLFPTRSATRNAAIASQALGHYADALELYDVLVSDFGAEMSDAEREGLEAERRALLAHFGQVVVRVGEAGVRVVVDGRSRGVSPYPGRSGSRPVRTSCTSKSSVSKLRITASSLRRKAAARSRSRWRRSQERGRSSSPRLRIDGSTLCLTPPSSG